MSNLNKGNKRKHTSTEEGEWKKISLEGEWEKISLKGEGEWRKISFDFNKMQDVDEEEKKSIHHETMLPLQDILKSKVSTPAVKSKVPTPVLKSKLPPPVLLPILPPPVVMTKMAHSASISNFQHPASMSNLQHPASMSNLQHTVTISNFQPPVMISQVSPSASVSNLAIPAAISNLHNPVMTSNATPPISITNLQSPVSISTVTPTVSKPNVSTAEIRNFLESEILNKKAISEPVFYSNISSSVQKSVTKPVEFSDCILYLPDTDDPPAVRQNYSESNQIYVSGIPTYVSENTVKRIFENCGTIKRLKFNGRDGCHLQFDSKESACKAVKLTGSRIRPKPSDKVHRGSSTKRLFIYFEKPVEDTIEKSSLTKYQKKETTDYSYNYTNKRGRQVSRVFKDETRYLKAIPDLMFWLKRGECKKETNSSFLNIMKSLFESQVSRLNKEAEVIQMNYSKAEMPVQQVMEKISVQLDDICKIFNYAKKKNVWCSFSKWQKKNLELCRLMTLEIRKVHYQELIENRREVEMELSDQECDSDEMNSSKCLVKSGKKDFNFSFQAGDLGTLASSSQDKLFENVNKLSNTYNYEDTMPSVSNKTVYEESDFDELYSSENHGVEVKKEDLSFQSNNSETPVESSLECDEKSVIPIKTICQEDSAVESTVTSTVSSKIIMGLEGCESDGINSCENLVKIEKENSSFNFQINSEISANSSFKLPFLDSSYQEDIAESTVTSTDQSKMIADPEECDSNGISSSDVVSNFQEPANSSIDSSKMITSSVNPKEDCDNMNISQNDLRLMILITSFLMICPVGASLESVCQHLNSAQPLFESQTVLNVLKKFPNLFREDFSRSNDNCVTNWKFVGLNIK